MTSNKKIDGKKDVEDAPKDSQFLRDLGKNESLGQKEQSPEENEKDNEVVVEGNKYHLIHPFNNRNKLQKEKKKKIPPVDSSPTSYLPSSYDDFGSLNHLLFPNRWSLLINPLLNKHSRTISK